MKTIKNLLFISYGLAGVLMLLPGEPLYAQEAVLLNTEGGSISLSEYSQSTGFLISSRTTNSSVSATLNNRCSNTAEMTAGRFTVSDSHRYNGGICRGGSEGSYSMYVYAKVIPNTSLRVKIQANMSLTWNNFVTAGDQANTQFYFLDTGGGSSAALGYNFSGASGQLSGSKIIEHNTSGIVSSSPPSPILVSGGVNYYYIGKIVLNGYIQTQADNGAKTASFNSTIQQNVDVRYIGEILKKADGDNGDNQTWVVGQQAPKPLIVKVFQGETGAPLSGKTVAFTLSDPNNNVLNQTSAVTGQDGLAQYWLTFGNIPGAYKVKAYCATCVAGLNEVVFTETAVPVEQVTELRKLSGDGTMPVGRQTLNPLRVQAFNTMINKGVKNFGVDFSIVSVPVGGNDADIGVPHTITDKFGIAKSSFTLGKSEGDYVVKARCESCKRNKEVLFTITGGPPTEDEHPSEEGDKTAFPPPDTPDDISVLQIAFQNTKMRESNSFKAVTREDSRIGVLKTDHVTFKGFIAPAPTPPLTDSDYVWSGAVSGSGKTIEKDFNNTGTFDLTLTVKGKNRTVKITVAEINSTLSDWDWHRTPSNLPFVPIVLSCGFAAQEWAGLYDLYSYTHNNVADAMKHAYWNACITNMISAEVAASAANAHEYTNLNDPKNPSPHNENVMDLENNAIGRNIGGNFPYLIGAAIIQEEIKATAKNGVLTVIDLPSNEIGAGLLIPSK